MKKAIRSFIYHYIKDDLEKDLKEEKIDDIIKEICEYDENNDYPYWDLTDLFYNLNDQSYILYNLDYLSEYDNSEEQVWIDWGNLKVILNIWFPCVDNLEEMVEYIINTNKEARNIKRKIDKVL